MPIRLSRVNTALSIAGAVEADHQAVADQHVVTHALEVGHVLDARLALRSRRAGAEAEREGKAETEAGGEGAEPAGGGMATVALPMGSQRV